MDERPTICSIGYEGATLDQFLARLTAEGIEIVVDVRANAISRKKGFSKRALIDALSDRLVQYVHLPALGIPTAIRERYKPSERAALLDYYEAEILPTAQRSVETVATLARNFKIALLCFERDPELCHRDRIAKRLQRDRVAVYRPILC